MNCKITPKFHFTKHKYFKKVPESSEEMAAKEQAEEQLRAVTEKLKFKQRQAKEVDEDVKAMQARMDTLRRDESAYAELLEQKEALVSQLKREIDSLEAKRDRALTQAARVARDLRRKRREREEAGGMVCALDD